METAELIEVLSRGEDSRHQFEENFTNADALAAEIVAFSNSAGGQIFIGVQNDGTVIGLSHADIDRLNQLIANTSSQNVRPAVNPLTENVLHPNGTVLVVTIPEGLSKPYMDKNGAIWVKSGADKRRATSREELQRLFQQAGLVHADETPVAGLGVSDLDLPYFAAFFEQQFGEPLTEHKNHCRSF
jgi:ATP-dependent DNA helicase RecG